MEKITKTNDPSPMTHQTMNSAVAQNSGHPGGSVRLRWRVWRGTDQSTGAERSGMSSVELRCLARFALTALGPGVSTLGRSLLVLAVLAGI
jgi:hypothetical protein